MGLRMRLAALVVFFVVLIGLATWGRAQPAVAPRAMASPVVLAGPDIGFRMTAAKGDVPVGQLVVRIKGEWKVVEFAASSYPLGK
jgi:hypothetical protein